MGHDLSPTRGAQGQRARLAIVLGITLTILVVEVVGALISGSLALLADAGHMLTDAAGLGLALLAIWFASRPATPGRTYGYYRLEILAAVVNSVLLFGVGLYVLVEAVRRLLAPPDVGSGVMLVFAFIGMAGNAVSLWLLRQGQKESLNVRGAFLEVMADFLGSAAVLVAALVIATTGLLRADPIASAIIGLLILPRTWRLLREAVDVLLEATPKGMDLSEVRRHILDVPGVFDLHDLHAWTITSGLNVISVHVVTAPEADVGLVLDKLRLCLADHFDVEHSTFQLEPTTHRAHEQSVHT
jgi:cobalt-zinc-cadmium efflux system protein